MYAYWCVCVKRKHSTVALDGTWNDCVYFYLFFHDSSKWVRPPQPLAREKLLIFHGDNFCSLSFFLFHSSRTHSKRKLKIPLGWSTGRPLSKCINWIISTSEELWVLGAKKIIIIFQLRRHRRLIGNYLCHSFRRNDEKCWEKLFNFLKDDCWCNSGLFEYFKLKKKNIFFATKSVKHINQSFCFSRVKISTQNSSIIRYRQLK